jgi:Carbohydrate family 9 binding domain-like
MKSILQRKLHLYAAALACIALGGCSMHFPWTKKPVQPLPESDATVAKCVHAETGARLTADPAAPFWKAAQPVFMDRDRYGQAVPALRTAVYTRWTDRNLYVLFVCPYDLLHLKDDPRTQTKTWQLWKWDVAEMFIGSDFTKIQAYKEFEMSPQEEWLDLDIDLTSPTRGQGMAWSSNFDVVTRIDKDKKIWYGAMKIPMVAILPPGSESPTAGDKFRVNFFRSQGPGKQVHMLAWQPPMSDTFHVPEKFGTLLLVDQPQ